jgi:hypothetical protein
MDVIIGLILATIALAVFAAASITWGVDSRDGSDDPRRPAYPVGIR